MPIEITSPEKIIWPANKVTKHDYMAYLIQISPYMLPFLNNRLLTVIRYPHGVENSFFYQKNCPDYAPDYVETVESEGINYIVCNSVYTLCWLGNQLAIEFHVPFQAIGEAWPLEIVFDLDPPDTDHFFLAVKAAREIHTLLHQFRIKSYPKLSGNKGIQIHIPVYPRPLSYEDTRIFTGFIAQFLTEKFPDLFTTERMKKNRGGRLYIDYVQHAEGKTIIAPYSARGSNPYGQVAAPLYWNEVNDSLSPRHFTLDRVLKRVKEAKCPFHDYFTSENLNLYRFIRTLKANM